MIWLLLQASAPDIQLELRAEAREVRTEVDGDARLTVRAEPDGGGEVRTTRTPQAPAAVQRGVRVVTRAEARIADPAARPRVGASNEVNAPEPATPEPDPR